MITRNFLNFLLTQPELKSFLQAFNEKNQIIEHIAPGIFKETAKNILDRKYAKSAAEKKEHDTLDGRTLHGILTDKSPNLTTQRINKIKFILSCFDLPELEWNGFIFDSSPAFEKIAGYWYVYRFDYELETEGKIQRTILYIDNGANRERTSFQSLHNYYTNGNVSLKQTLLTVGFQNNFLSLEITAHVPETKNKINILNGILRSTKDSYPYVKQCVMLFVGSELLNNSLHEMKPLDIKPNLSVLINRQKEYSVDQTEQIIFEYLNRKRNHIFVKSFESIDDIVVRNEKEHQKTKTDSYLLKMLSGDYFLFFSFHYDNSYSLFQTALSIFDNGDVSQLVMGSEKDFSEIHKYHGKAVIVSDTVRFNISNRVIQRSDYLLKFGASATNMLYMPGLTSDTHRDGTVYADICIAVARNELTDMLFEAKILSPSDPDYQKVENFLSKILKSNCTIKEYFFTRYKSIEAVL